MLKYKKLVAVLLAVVLILGSIALAVNFFVIFSQSRNILTVDEASAHSDAEYIMVLGCGVVGDEPSDMLRDRLLKAIEVAEKIPDVKIVVTGNNSGPAYDEVSVMKNFCIKNGIDESRILTDDDGFSTGASVTNLKKIFGGKKTIIVTQKYHLYRALHIASQYDIEAFGVASNQHRYNKQLYYSLREVAARNKDFIKYFNV